MIGVTVGHEDRSELRVRCARDVDESVDVRRVVDAGIDGDERARADAHHVAVRPVERHRRGIGRAQTGYHTPSSSGGIANDRVASICGVTVRIGLFDA